MTSERRRQRAGQDTQPAEQEHPSGWAHFERVAEREFRFIEWCPDPAGPHGSCGSALHHAWRTSQSRRAEILRRLGQHRWGVYDPALEPAEHQRPEPYPGEGGHGA